jgi:hemoglobin-like flavoprotein
MPRAERVRSCCAPADRPREIVTVTVKSLDRIRRSYEILLPQVGRVTSRFYEALFAAWPETRRLFTRDIAVQQKHLAAALALVVRNLSVLDALEEPLRELGAGHARAGVRPEHYPVVCDAMVLAIGQTLGTAWTAELEADWRGLLERVAGHMQAGGSESKSE